MKPTVISTFAGCGGSSFGYYLAGFNELLMVEWENNAVETFKLNFPDVPVYHGDIAKLSSQECMELAGISKGELDVFDGSPPCQGFSTAGKRKYNDPRNSLFIEYARLLNDLQPKVFVMENVTGMIKGYMKQAYLQIMKTLRECGYKAKGQVMNAMYFNVPQSRERVIIIGVREDLGIELSHPRPENNPMPIKQILDDCPQEILAPQLKGKMGRLSAKLKQGQTIQDLTGKYGYGNLRLKWTEPSPTIVKTACFGAPKMIHPFESRGISIDEAKRIHSFPDEFKFLGGYEKQWSCIGNSVPPNFMRAIAEHIKTNILEVTNAR